MKIRATLHSLNLISNEIIEYTNIPPQNLNVVQFDNINECVDYLSSTSKSDEEGMEYYYVVEEISKVGKARFIFEYSLVI